MVRITLKDMKGLCTPLSSSHKGQNGRLLIVGGSHLFHSASIWALTVASRIVDLVHYSSVLENNEIVQKAKAEFRNGIVISRKDIEDYIKEDDCILIGPGMLRAKSSEIPNSKFQIPNLKEIESIENEGIQTYYMTKYLLQKYPNKKWVIDAGALQMLDLEDIPKGAILTPHQGEFERLKSKVKNQKLKAQFKSQKLENQVMNFSKEYKCIVLLKGEFDIISDGENTVVIEGGNAGMTKGGTGDVLAGLIASLYTKNEAWKATVAGAFINKKAGEDLYKNMGLWFNASDLADQIPQTMKRLLF